jgi:hypothetical protein
VVVDVQDHARALREGQDPPVPCKRCNTPLAFDGSRALLHLLGGHAARVAAQGDEPARAPAEVPAAASLPPPAALPQIVAAPSRPPAAAPRGNSGAVIMAALGAVALVAGGFLAFRGREPAAPPQPVAVTSTASPGAAPGAAPTSAPGASVGWAKVDDLPPPWVERPFVIEGDSIYVVGRGGPASNEESALSLARSDAVERLTANMLGELVGAPIHDFVQARVGAGAGAAGPERRPEIVEPVSRRFLTQVGVFATPERVDAVMRKREGGVEAVARYKLSKESFKKAVATYRATVSFQGITVARFFPQLEASIRTQGELVIVDVQKNWQTARSDVRAGDVVLDVNGRPVTTVETFEKLAGEEWASTPPNGIMTIRLESLGARRALELRKPAAAPSEQPTYNQ